MEAFKEVFGEHGEEGDIEKQNQVFSDFLTKFPDGKAKPGVARAAGYRISSVVKSVGSRKERAQ